IPPPAHEQTFRSRCPGIIRYSPAAPALAQPECTGPAHPGEPHAGSLVWLAPWLRSLRMDVVSGAAEFLRAVHYCRLPPPVVTFGLQGAPAVADHLRPRRSLCTAERLHHLGLGPPAPPPSRGRQRQGSL